MTTTTKRRTTQMSEYNDLLRERNAGKRPANRGYVKLQTASDPVAFGLATLHELGITKEDVQAQVKKEGWAK
jgi:hypothetical protein